MALSVFACACNKEAPPTAGEARAEPLASPAAATMTATGAAKPAEPAPAPAALAQPKISEDNFELVIAPKGAYEVGKPAAAEIVLNAKGAFKINEQYPYKFKLKDAAGLKFPAPVVGKDQVKLEKKRATMPVAFTPEKDGKHTVSGLFAFSICTDDKCLIERRELALDIDVK